MWRRWSLPYRPCTFTGTSADPCEVQKFKTVIFYTTACNSIFCMLAIAVERWRTLSTTVRLRRSNHLAKISVVAGWIATVAYAVVLGSISSTINVRIEYDGVFDMSCPTFDTNRTTCSDYRVCFPASKHAFLHMEIYHIITLILVFIVPLCTISVIYCLLVIRLLRNADKNNRGLSGTHRAKLRAIQAMVLVVIIFAICWLPGHIYVIWSINHMIPNLENDQLMTSMQRIPIRYRIFSDFVTHLTFSHHWIHTLIYPRYSRQIASAIRETQSSLISIIPLPKFLQRNSVPKSPTGTVVVTTSF